MARKGHARESGCLLVASKARPGTSEQWREKTLGEQSKPRHYKDLLVWQKGIVLAKMVYKLTATFPTEERYGLVAQMRRAAVSVPSNIAEGQARRGTKEFVQFLSHAEGSLAELETQLLLSIELEFAGVQNLKSALQEIDELQKMLVALKRKLVGYSPLATRYSPLRSAERK